MTDSNVGPMRRRHNGNLINALALRTELEERGERFRDDDR
jgi:glutamine phosphoribosylpyrophosphate amidotransferase